MHLAFSGRIVALASMVPVLLFPLPVQADSLTVQNLLESCNSAENSAGWWYCRGLIYGIGFALAQTASQNVIEGKRPPDLSICFGESFPPIGAGVRVFTNWANAHPDLWGESDTLGVTTALVQTWPCR